MYESKVFKHFRNLPTFAPLNKFEIVCHHGTVLKKLGCLACNDSRYVKNKNTRKHYLWWNYIENNMKMLQKITKHNSCMLL